MPPSRSESSDHQKHVKKPYNLRSSPSKSESSLPDACRSSPILSPLSMSSNDSDELSSLHLEIRTTCKSVSKVEALLSNNIKQLRKASTICDKSVISDVVQTVQELAKTRRERDDITALNQDIWAADEALQCPVCHDVIDKPFTVVECRHTCCYNCLVTWFHQCIRNRLHYHKEKVTEKFKNHLEPFTKVEIQTLCDGRDSILPGRYYECPMCRVFISDAPIEIPVFRDVVGAIAEVLDPDVHLADQMKPADPTAPWVVFF
ncbi:hypothetical protein EV702DRAFT_1203775 [Suillus placidus]|uniref:RING-type domain-containing protein n=1 Tax=Suillus placidus TaxID=48579 RepID=A0A9P6ZI49_9AGAM|nr:hypothetical protein EV702DRAFT_1203775 [Suillus placidus]